MVSVAVRHHALQPAHHQAQALERGVDHLAAHAFAGGADGADGMLDAAQGRAEAHCQSARRTRDQRVCRWVGPGFEWR